jgi:hypothetical protein
MYHKTFDNRRVTSSLTLSGPNPVVRILRKELPAETFDGVGRVLRTRDAKTRCLDRVDFIGEILTAKRVSFGSSVVEIHNHLGVTVVEDAVGIEIVSGGIEEISDSTPKS